MRLNLGGPNPAKSESVCLARTRAGGQCHAPARKIDSCRMHGGLSTGPTTASGKQRSLTALRTGHEKWRARHQGRMLYEV
ncbi:MAG: HGGxSTG domain-containing protein [Hyphomicrobiaceae bacterium]